MAIDKLKSVISKRGGLARSNRFRVIMTPPETSLLNITEFSLESIARQRSLKSLINDPRDVSLLCDSVNIPGKQILTLDRTTNKYTTKIPYGVLNEDVSMSFLLTNDYYMKSVFDSWHNLIVEADIYNIAYKSDISTDVIIQQLDNEDRIIYSAKLVNAFPTTVNSVALSNSSENENLKVEVSFTYTRIESGGALQGGLDAISSIIGIKSIV